MDAPNAPLFDLETVRLDEYDGSLRQSVPPELLIPGARYAVLRRYITKAAQRGFETELRLWAQSVPTLERDLNEEQITKRDDIWCRMVAARLVEWNYKAPDGSLLSPTDPASLLEIPSTHADALISAMHQLSVPRSDADSFRLGREARSVADAGSNDQSSAGGDGDANGGVVEVVRAPLPEGS